MTIETRFEFIISLTGDEGEQSTSLPDFIDVQRIRRLDRAADEAWMCDDSTASSFSNDDASVLSESDFEIDYSMFLDADGTRNGRTFSDTELRELVSGFLVPASRSSNDSIKLTRRRLSSPTATKVQKKTTAVTTWSGCCDASFDSLDMASVCPRNPVGGPPRSADDDGDMELFALDNSDFEIPLKC